MPVRGRRELFEGLWIAENTDWEWKEHPVVVLDFNEIPHRDPETLGAALSGDLRLAADRHGIPLETDFPETRLRELILGLRDRFDAGVVFLVDEYDKPIVSHLGKGEEALEIARRNRDVMKGFFGVLKGAKVAPCLRFVFFTGVSKFSRVSIFSDLNNLEDLTLVEEHADMLGYTREELEDNFGPHIAAMAEKLGIPEAETIRKLADHYDGYRFSEREVRVYNPFSVMSALKRKTLGNYWFETGTPTFLVNLLRERDYPLPRIENLESDIFQFGAFDLENLNPEAILFQTGYITIKNVEDRIHTFDYPNREVKTAFLKHLFLSYANETVVYSRMFHLARDLRREAFEDFFAAMRAIFADIPYALQIQRDESYYHTIFYLAVSASVADARSEVLTCEGRIDLRMEFPDKVFVLEFKCGQGADAAIRQIREKDYAGPSRGTGKRIFLVGIDFDAEKRNISEWKVEAD
jgi:hypothetical protein